MTDLGCFLRKNDLSPLTGVLAMYLDVASD
jgi:hypothetical protein